MNSAAIPIDAGPRWAIYWVPEPTHPLWQAGCRWLCRDEDCAEPATPDPAKAPSHAQSPWRYGFHATLKPPMRLRPGLAEADFLRAVEGWAVQQPSFTMPPLQVAWLGDFLALRPEVDPPASHLLHQLADRAVADLDEWRQPLAADELARRAAQVHCAEQFELLSRWGYPHVFKHWRFHMSLSDSAPAQAAELMASARAHFAPSLTTALQASAIAVFREDAPGAALRLLRRFALG